MNVIPEISSMTLDIAQALRKIEGGEQVSYVALSEQVNFDVIKNRHLLSSARRILKGERVIFGAVRGVGLKRLTDSEIAESGTHVLRHINRSAKRGGQTLGCVNNYAGLTPSQQIRWNASMSLLGVFYEVSRPRSLKQIEATVAVMQKKLPIRETLQAFLAVS